MITASINSRTGVQVLVQSSILDNVALATIFGLYSDEDGYAVKRNNACIHSTTRITQMGLDAY